MIGRCFKLTRNVRKPENIVHVANNSVLYSSMDILSGKIDVIRCVYFSSPLPKQQVMDRWMDV